MSEDPPRQWKRISPLSVVFFIFKLVRQIGIQALPALVVGFAAFNRFEGSAWLIPLLAAGSLLVLGFGLLSYLRFRYCITNDRVLVRRGVMHREELDIDFDRVQNVNIREPFYMRPFSLAVLAIDTAGSSGKEVELVGVKREQALDIRARLLGAIESEKPAEPQQDSAEKTGDDDILLELGRKDVLIYGLTANMMLWLVLAVGAVMGSDEISGALINHLKASPVLQQTIESIFEQGGRLLLGLAAAGLLLLVLLTLPLISMLGALFRFDGYRLSRRGDTFRKSSGLLTRHDESVRQHKIQALVWKQNLIARWFGRVNLQLRQASAGKKVENGQLPTGLKSRFMVPVLRPGQANRLSGVFLPGCSPLSAVLSPIDTTRYVRVHLAIVLAIAAIPIVALSFLHIAFLGGLLVIGVPAWLILRRIAAKFGWAVTGDYGVFRQGFVGEATTIFPLFKVQRVDIRQTPPQARKGIAKLTVHLASHSLVLPYLAVADAQRLRDIVLYEAESSSKRWF